MLFVWQLAANRTAFSSISPCVLVQNAVYLAPNAVYLAAKRTAFSIKTHAILHQNALNFAANSPERGANGGLLK